MNTSNLIFPTNRVVDIENCFLNVLKPLYPEQEIRTFFGLLCEAFLGWNKVALLLHRNETVNQSDLLRFHWALDDLKQYRPIQHIVGYTDFCGCRIVVNKNVLIPRSETEEMVCSLTSMYTGPMRCALDLCTGSGCIAISLKKKFPQCSVTAVDISSDALKTARTNATSNNVEVMFVQDDVLCFDRNNPYCGLEPPDNGWDLIVCNPPYVTESEKSSINRNVLDYEPHLALFVPDSDPMLFYRHIASFALHNISATGLLAVEINERFGQSVLNLLDTQGFDAVLHKDFRMKERFVTASLKASSR